jgi:adenylate kinase family enzyme
MAGLASHTYDPTIPAEFEFELAKSGRSTCRNPKCLFKATQGNRKIQKGALRIARVEDSPTMNRKVPKWVHLECCAPVILQEAVTRYKGFERLPGFDELEAEKQSEAVEIVMGILGIENSTSGNITGNLPSVLKSAGEDDVKCEATTVMKKEEVVLLPVPEIVIIVGLPGSGKTSFATRLVANGFVRISQDDMGRKKCEAMARQCASDNKRVVLDRCNVTSADRIEWLGMMKRRDSTQHVAAVFFDFDQKTCVERVYDRTNHPTIKGGNKKKAGTIVGVQFNKLEPPREGQDGIDKVYTIRSFEEAERILQSWETALSQK